MNLKPLVQKVKINMIENYISVNQSKNPVSLNLKNLDQYQLKHIMEQYAIFSRKIVSFLTDAFYVMDYEGWEEIKDELNLNIREEFGQGHNHDKPDSENQKDEKHNPHYVQLRRGFKDSLRIDLSAVKVSKGTQEFITGIHNNVSVNNPAYVAGGVFALETSATPELIMTYKFTNHLFKIYSTKVPKEIEEFFLSHINEIEILHEERLEEACSKYIKTENQCNDFERGFEKVISIMDNWWNQLYKESQLLN